jgi:hypothetical protein
MAVFSTRSNNIINLFGRSVVQSYWITTPMTLHRELAIMTRMTEDEGEKEHMLMKTRVQYRYYLAGKGWTHLTAARLRRMQGGGEGAQARLRTGSRIHPREDI